MKRGVALILTALLAAVGSNGARVGAAAAQDPVIEGISAEALAQIEALIREKDTRSGAQLKMDSQLIYELKMASGLPVAAGVPTVATDLEYTIDDRLVLDVKGAITDAFVLQLRGMGYQVISADTVGGSVRLLSDIFSVEALAALPQVAFVQPKQDAVTSRMGPTPTIEQRRRDRSFLRRSAFRAYIQAAIAASAETSAGTGVGSRSSEGDVAHSAFAARGAFGVDGTGVKIGVLSDGVTNLAASQALGDLGPVTVLPGQAGSGDEGTAMLEIIHDVAPGAQLFFATAFGGITSFANNIRALRLAGCDIIVDDVFYFVETPFQDGQLAATNTNGGVVIQAVNDVTADGALYFSSAGNSGNLNDNTSGVWEGDFVDGGATGAPLPVGRLHSFGSQAFNPLTVANTAAPISLYWSDPLGGSSNDYDLFRLNAAGTAVAAASANIQDGNDDPIEQISQSTVNPRIVIVKKNAAAARFLHLNANRGRFSIATSGQTHGHSAAAAAYSVAATPASAAFPNPFTSSNEVETFSSDGPRRVFYQPNGTPITPGDVSSTGGLLRQKPDITAADGVAVTGVGGFPSPFFGTSAAAPHAAAIAALLKDAMPPATPADIRAALTSSAIDIESPGVDRDSGAGIIMPVLALQSIGAPNGTAFFAVTSFAASENPGNGNGTINAGEGASLSVTLRNLGVQNATDVSATIATATPGAMLTLPVDSPYPDMAALSGTGTNTSPYLFTLAPDVPCPLPIDFTLNINYAGGSQAVPLQVATGPSSVTITSTLDTTPPASGSGYTGATGVQNARLFRDGIASTCAPPKAFPGTTAPGARQFDVFNVSMCPEATPACATATLSGVNAINLFTAAYSPNFDPTNLGTNYIGDPGSSAATRTYSFPAPGAGGQIAVTVHDVPPNLAAPSGSAYTLQIDGVCAGACATPNQIPVAKAKNVTVSADDTCTANASIDDGSFDPDGDAITLTQSPAGPYPLGTTTVLLTVTDPFGATSQATGTVTVIDDTPPTITDPSVSSAVLWPPNHQMVPIIVSYSMSDACSPGGSCTLTVSSNEPINGPDDGNTSPDWEVIDDHRLLIRAERSGIGTGRVYTIKVTCTDGLGNTTSKKTTVKVPLSR